MSSLWPWLTAAGLGALHGLNPANGWMLAAAWGVHRRDPATVALGLSMDRGVLQGLALGLLVAVALVYLSRRRALHSPAG